MNNRYHALLDIIKDKMSYAAHDYDHVMRVYRLCLLLAQEDRSVDMEVLIPAVLLHDIARRQEDEDHTGEIDHAVLGSELAEGILKVFGYDEELIEKIKHCILTHRFRTGSEPQSREAKILFDADKLDVIGAVGIARSYMLAGEHGEKMYYDINVEDYLKENVGPNGRIKDVSKHTANLEFELKLKKIPERLYTAKAKKIAEDRIAYMENFFARLQNEIRGE